MPQRYRAFLAMPFRSKLEWIREAIRRATKELGIDLAPVDEMLVPGADILAAIRQAIRDCSLAYAVLIDLNPNVMYELGLLHEASKPTILLGDPETIQRLPFDIRTRQVLTFRPDPKAADDLTRAVIAATGRLLALFDPKNREKAIHAEIAPEYRSLHVVQLSIGRFDWERLKNEGARAVNREGCSTKNISPYDGDDFKGWRLKATCRNGDTIYVYVDLDGDISSVDVQ